MNRLILMVGLPGSGKSTKATEITKDHKQDQERCVVVNPDSIRQALYGQAFILDAEPMVWVIAKLMVKALFNTGYTTVILDSCNMTKKARDEWKSPLWERQYIFVNTDRQTCLQRIHNRQGRNSINEILGLCDTVDRMYRTFEPVLSSDVGAGTICQEETGYILPQQLKFLKQREEWLAELSEIEE